MSKYTIKIKTADERFAGTDSNIFIQLIGTLGFSNDERLNGHISGNAFERNQIDTVTLDPDNDLGDIYQIKLHSDTKYAGSDWKLSWIEISKAQSKTVAHYDINSWIADTSVKTYVVSSGLTIEDKQNRVTYTDKTGDIFTIPADCAMDADFSYNVKTGFLLSETKVTNIGTKTDMSGNFERAPGSGEVGNAIKAALSFGLTTSHGVTSQEQLSFDHTETRKVNYKLEKSSHERRYWVTCSYEREEHILRIGDLEFIIPRILTARFAGFKELTSEELGKYK
jgi:hypothetical protein